MSEEDKIHYALKEMPKEERPRERLIRDGEEALSSAELLAIILRTGTQEANVLSLANYLLRKSRSLQALRQCSLAELAAVKDIGMAKACQIKAALELGWRAFSDKQEEKPIIKSPSDATNLLTSEMRYLDREHLKVILLNTRSMFLGAHTVSVGTLNASLGHQCECFKEAVRQSGASVIFFTTIPVVTRHPAPKTFP